MQILTVVGNRPQFIKSAPLSLALARAGFTERTLHTGQHYDAELSEVFFHELGLAEPLANLGIGGLPREEMLERMQTAIGRVLSERRPDWLVVFGDTNSTLAGARAGQAHGVPVAHVEAGLRSGDLTMPEERNRIEADGISELLLCPDTRSAEQLRAEGRRGEIEVVGDVMADALRVFGPPARERGGALLARLGLEAGRYLLVTVHRDANTSGRRLARILEGLARLDEPAVLPLHPRTRAAIEQAGLRLPPGLRSVPPLGYLDFTALAAQARVIVTDSGGLQKEAYWHGVPCVTLRPSTEWPDTLAAGANTLVDDDPDRLVQAVSGASMPHLHPPLYGDGYASERIAEALARLQRP